MADKPAAELTPLIPREQAENTFRKAVALFVGRGRLFSVDQLAKGVGVKPKAIYDFLSYGSGHPDYRPPHFGLVLSISAFLGADFTNEWLKLAHQGAFDLPDDEPDPGDLAVQGAKDSATVVAAAMDGRFDRKEKADLRVIGARKIRRGKQLLAMGARA